MCFEGKDCLHVKATSVTDGCLCLRFVRNSIFLNPGQNSHWFNLNISSATGALVLQALTQITYAVFLFFIAPSFPQDLMSAELLWELLESKINRSSHKIKDN